MPFIPHTNDDIKAMLQTIGKRGVEELFNSIPSKFRLKADSLRMNQGLSESEAKQRLEAVANSNKLFSAQNSFMGAGAYNHFIPSALNHIVGRSEFYTAYTPYQPEISQGTLQAIFEFQTMMCRLTGLDVSNASMYDGATALAEAVLVAYHYKREKKKSIIVPKNIHPEYMDVLKGNLSPFGINIIAVDYDAKTGAFDVATLKTKINADIFAVILQCSNYFGVEETYMADIPKIAKENDAVPIMLTIDPTRLGMFKSAGELGYDIAVLEIQSFGNPVAFGGPHAGVIVARKEFVRNMPGRIIGETKDVDGKRAFVLTLATREQHIRREKATSNICSNQALVALRTAVYLSLMGDDGLKKLAQTNYALSHYAYDAVVKAGALPMFEGYFYNEFTVKFKTPEIRNKVYSGLKSEGFLPGLKLGSDGLLIAVTEQNNKESIDAYASAMGRYCR